MPKIRILKDYSASEGWKPGDVVDATFDVSGLLIEGKVELVDDNKKPEVVEEKTTETEVTADEAVKAVEVEKKEEKVEEVEQTEEDVEATKKVEGDSEGA